MSRFGGRRNVRFDDEDFVSPITSFFAPIFVVTAHRPAITVVAEDLFAVGRDVEAVATFWVSRHRLLDCSFELNYLLFVSVITFRCEVPFAVKIVPAVLLNAGQPH